MSIARAIFCERIATIRGAIAEFELQDLPPIPTNVPHNQSARIIRNGLAIQSFNIFEDFVKARTEEVLTAISGSGVQFGHLPVDFQWATTVDTIKAIEHQFKLRDRGDRIQYAQDYAEKIYSTKLPNPQLAEIAFFHSASNISKVHFRDALSAFGVDNPWAQVSGLCSRLGVSGVPAENVFHSFAQRRHQAAHVASASVSETDLTQSLLDATGLGLCYDVLVTKAAKLMAALTAPQPAGACLLTDQATIPLRFIKYTGSSFCERREGSRRSIRVNADASALLPAAIRRSNQENGLLVAFDSAGIPTQWSA